MSTQVSLGRKAGLLGISAALAATMAIPAAAAAQDETAMVRVLHGVGDAPAVDVYADGNVLIDALAFPNITEYAEVPAGTYQIQVVPDGATLEEGPVVIDAELTFDAGTMTTVAATGSLADEIIPQVVLDEPMASADGAQLRASHFSFDAPAVDIAPVGGDPVLTDVPFGATSPYLDLPAGALDLEIRPAGTEDAVFTIPTLELEAGTSYSAYAVGSLEAGTFTVVPAVDATLPGTAEVRVLHGSPDAPAVDVYANGGAVLENVPFGVISDYLEVPAGTYQIQVVPAGASLEEGPVVIDAELTFEADTRTTVAATGPLAEIAPQVLSDPAPTALVRVIHLSADSPRVDIAGTDAPRRDAIVKGLRFGRATDYLQVPAGEYDLEVRPEDGGRDSELYDIPPFTVEAGEAYAAIAIGSLADETFTVLLVQE